MKMSELLQRSVRVAAAVELPHRKGHRNAASAGAAAGNGRLPADKVRLGERVVAQLGV